MPKVSVIVAVHNKADYILQTLTSVLKQSFRDYECLIADDGSKDESFKIASLFPQLNPRFHLFKDEACKGTSRTLNTLLEIASGELVCQLDGDDILPVYAIETLVKYLENNKDTGFVYTDGQWIDSRGEYIKNKSYQYRKPCDPIYWLSHPCALHFKMWRNCNLRFDENITFGEDWDFNLNLMHTCKVHHLREIHYLQRYCPFSKSWTVPTHNQEKELFKIHRKWKRKYLWKRGLPRPVNWSKHVIQVVKDA